jgi:hypothetical protein
MRRVGVLWTAVGLLSLVGCAKQDTTGRLPISGKVTFQGAPLESGSIQFRSEPDGQQGSGAPITNGEYTVPAKSGLAPGKYKVLISSGIAGQPIPEGQAPGESGPPMEDRIPAEYNANSDKFVDVSADKENKFDFAIP